MIRTLRSERGLTLVELIISAAIVATLAAIALPVYADVLDRVRIARAIADIRVLEGEILVFEHGNVRLPTDLAEIGRAALTDPWGSPYEYLSFAGLNGKGKARKDRFLVPLNSTYDLYSKGKDGRSQPPLTAKASHDDIVRANDGGYVGLASRY